jgi:hypothetical protein
VAFDQAPFSHELSGVMCSTKIISVLPLPVCNFVSQHPPSSGPRFQCSREAIGGLAFCFAARFRAS